MGSSFMTDMYGRTDDERRELKAKVDRLNLIARENWDNDQWKREMAQELTETIYRGFEHENLLQILAQVENLPYDGRSFISEVRGLKVFWIAKGGYIETSNMHKEIMEIQRDTLGFHVYEMEDKLRYNFAETQANLVQLATQRMDAEVNLRVLKAFQAAVPSNSPYYISGNGLSLAALNAGLRAVREEQRDFNVSIVGRVTMTDQIMEALTVNGTNTAFIPETNEGMLARGVLGTYRGARIVTLRNYSDDTRTPFFPANEMCIVGRDASKFAFWGGLLSKEYVEEDNWYWHYLARRDFGGVVHRPDRLRRIVDNSIAASTKTAS